MTDLLLTDGQLELAATGFDFGECKPEWRRVAKAQATQAVTEVFERIVMINALRPYPYSGIYIEDVRWISLKQELLGEEQGL